MLIDIASQAPLNSVFGFPICSSAVAVRCIVVSLVIVGMMDLRPAGGGTSFEPRQPSAISCKMPNANDYFLQPLTATEDKIYEEGEVEKDTSDDGKQG